AIAISRRKREQSFLVMSNIFCTMRKKKELLEVQIPEYGLEALVSIIDDDRELIEALKEAGQRFSTFKRKSDRPGT
ncbi:MAG: hypothetical protein ACJ70Z_01140, partial [Nitrososphaera sp.]